MALGSSYLVHPPRPSLKCDRIINPFSSSLLIALRTAATVDSRLIAKTDELIVDDVLLPFFRQFSKIKSNEFL